MSDVKSYAHQITTTNFILDHPRCYVANDPGCVDADTEFLTPTGWKRIAEYEETDFVTQFHPDTFQMEFVKPSAYVKAPCTDFIHFKNARGVDQVLTPEHRVLYYPETNLNKPMECSAREMAERHTSNRCGFSGRFANAGTLVSDTPGIALTLPELRVMVMVIADGTFVKGSPNLCRVKVKKDRKKERIKKLLTEANIPFKTTAFDDGYRDFRFSAPRVTKVFDTEFWKANIQQRETVLYESQFWDSCQRKNKSFCFSSYEKQNADFIQFCAVTTGHTASLRTNSRDRRGQTETEYVVHVRDEHQFRGIKSGSNKCTPERTTSSDGYKYCFTVPTSYLVLRRNGYVFTTGNTGKTKACIDAVIRKGLRALVICPLSIMEPSWGMDIRKFSQAQFEIAHGKNRSQALRKDVQFVITNHDAVNWLVKEPKEVIQAFDIMIVDECTAFKNRTTKRSKGLNQIANLIEYLTLMSGTPNTNKITDLWHQYYMLDRGERLGRSFNHFQNSMCIGQVQHLAGRRFTNWVDRPDAPELVHEKVKDITIRFKFEDCISIPDNQMILKELTMPAFIEKKYKELRDEQVLVHDGQIVNPVHAGARVKKLLQLLSGAVYNEDSDVVKVHNERYELVMDLVAEREQCLVGFNWKHEVQALTEIADKRKISYAVIDGSVKLKDREAAVRDFQKGDLQVIFAHPQSAGHGLTLTNGSATIWCSPTYNAEHYQQFNRRIYRAGQTQKTQTIRVAYADSKEIEVYAALDGKLERMEDLLTLLNQKAANDDTSPNNTRSVA